MLLTSPRTPGKVGGSACTLARSAQSSLRYITFISYTAWHKCALILPPAASDGKHKAPDEDGAASESDGQLIKRPKSDGPVPTSGAPQAEALMQLPPRVLLSHTFPSCPLPPTAKDANKVKGEIEEAEFCKRVSPLAHAGPYITCPVTGDISQHS